MNKINNKKKKKKLDYGPNGHRIDLENLWGDYQAGPKQGYIQKLHYMHTPLLTVVK
jgi:hypothetical protein